MSPAPPRRAAPVPAVLAIGPAAVEWFEREPSGALRQARVEPGQGGLGHLLQAAEEARRRAGGTARTCVLLLSAPHVFQRLVELPPLGRKELALVFQRRARALAGEDDPRVAFVAREMHASSAEPDAPARHTWLLAGASAAARELRLALRQRGFELHAAVSAELAGLEWARQHAPRPEEPLVALRVGEGQLSIALIAGKRLAYHQSIEGDLAQRPALATALVHEIRTCVAFWRKQSRGEGVAQVVVVGLPRERVEILALTLASIVPGASVHCAADGVDDADGRRALLAAGLVGGHLNPPLDSWLPPRRRLAGLLAALGAVACVGLAWLGFDQGAARVRAQRELASSLRQQSADLEQLAARNLDARASLERIDLHLQRARALESHGVPLEHALTLVLTAFDGQAELREFALYRDEDERTRVSVAGRCAGSAREFVPSLRVLLGRLERAGGFSEVELALPEEIAQETARELSFTIEAVLDA